MIYQYIDVYSMLIWGNRIVVTNNLIFLGSIRYTGTPSYGHIDGNYDE